jgi:hypothetical protein
VPQSVPTAATAVPLAVSPPVPPPDDSHAAGRAFPGATTGGGTDALHSCFSPSPTNFAEKFTSAA